MRRGRFGVGFFRRESVGIEFLTWDLWDSWVAEQPLVLQ